MFVDKNGKIYVVACCNNTKFWVNAGSFFEYFTEKASYTIYDIYKIDENSEAVKIVKYAEWDVSNGFTIKEPNIWKRRSNLNGHHLR